MKGKNWRDSGRSVVITKIGLARLVRRGLADPIGPNPCFQVVDGEDYIVITRKDDRPNQLLPVEEA
jgi:hypothetical protein